MKRIMYLVLSAAMVFSMLAGASINVGATGKAIEIWSIEDLYDIRYAPDKDYIMMADIDMEKDKNSGYMGTDGIWPTIESFSGCFDGNGHTISYLNANLFTTNSGEIKDLTLYGSQEPLLTTNEGVLDGVTVNRASCINMLAQYNTGSVLNCKVCDSHFSYLGKVAHAYTLANSSGMVSNNSGLMVNCGIINCSWLFAYDYYYYGRHPNDEVCYSPCKKGNQVYNAVFICSAICSKNTGTIKNSFCIASEDVNKEWTYYYNDKGNIKESIFFCKYQDGQIENCYANTDLCYYSKTQKTGSVNCFYTTSGTLTCADDPQLTNCYVNTGSISLELMKRESTFSGFDFENTWIIDKNVEYPYPQLRSNRQDAAKTIESISFKTKPSHTTYTVEESILADGELTVNYIDNTSETVPITAAMLSGYDMSVIGEQSVTVTYRDKSLTYTITVKPPHAVTGVTLISGPNKTEFIKGAALDYTGAVVRVQYADGTFEDINLTPDNTTGGSTEATGFYNVTYTNGDYKVTFRINVKEKAAGDDGAPAPVTITDIRCTNGAVSLSWKTVPGADGYRLYRKTGSGKWTTIVSSTTATSYTDTTVTEGKTYTYTLRSVKDGAWSTGYNDTAKSIKVEAAAPEPVTITDIRCANGAVSLAWNTVPGADGYRLYRKTGSGKWTTIVSSTTATSYTDTTVTEGKTYTYTLRSVKDGAWSTGYNDTAKSIKVEAAAPEPVTITDIRCANGAVSLAWNTVPGADGYRLYRKTGSGKWTTIVSSTTATSYTDTTVTEGKTYTYTLRSVKGGGWSTGYNDTAKSIKVEATVPEPVTITDIRSANGAVTLSWKAVPGADGYRIYRKTGSGKWTTIVSLTTATSYTDTAVTAGKTYKYTLRSVKDGLWSTGYNDTAKAIMAK